MQLKSNIQKKKKKNVKPKAAQINQMIILSNYLIGVELFFSILIFTKARLLKFSV